MYWCVCVYTSSEDEYVMCDVCGMCGWLVLVLLLIGELLERVSNSVGTALQGSL